MRPFESAAKARKQFKKADKGDRVVADVEIAGERGVGVFEFEGMTGNRVGLEDEESGETVGIARFDFASEERTAEIETAGRSPDADVFEMGVGAKEDCSPVDLGRHNPTGEFRGPGAVDRPNVDPVTKVCRDNDSGMFDDFF